MCYSSNEFLTEIHYYTYQTNNDKAHLISITIRIHSKFQWLHEVNGIPDITNAWMIECIVM